AVAAVPDRGADHVAAAHGVADQVVVQAVAAQHAGLAQVAELGVADGPGRVLVIHRMAALSLRIGRLNDDVAAEIGDLAPVKAIPQVPEVERGAQGQLVTVHGLDGPFLRGRSFWIWSRMGLTRSRRALGAGDDDAVADLPAAHRLGQGDG